MARILTVVPETAVGLRWLLMPAGKRQTGEAAGHHEPIPMRQASEREAAPPEILD